MDTMTGNEMIAIPAGQVTLADRRTRRSWTVELAPYRLAATPVTQALYAQVTGRRPSTGRGGRLPVEGVSWWDAVRFCNALSEQTGLTPAYRIRAESDAIDWDTSADGYRLPTEAEWEYACRAGTSGPRYGELDEIGWYRGNSAERMHEVGGKRPNAWGLHDMLGNVWDWCWDVYDAEVYGAYRVLRGGGWFDEHWSCRASARRRSHPSFQVDDVGFRLARSTVPQDTRTAAAHGTGGAGRSSGV
ncbi:SUMF1/EgtB/PvdO family nonheme iron enzyme [Streptomyces griseus]|uniref:formylglycine-generating enzyme family protein n=1 Tax=Streptomyces griseus TaxID=1911 RepID=UPI00067C1F3E|nr:SUMF1/EgtB/PvdO family nonheme iron enzyme [Streptomyces griseus]